MTDEDRRDTNSAEQDHPQTIKLEDDARGGSETFKHVPEPPRYETERGEASAIPMDAELGEDAEAVRRQAAGAETIGDAVGGGPGRDVGTGTLEPDRIGRGEPPASTGGAEPIGTYTPGESRD